MYQVLALNGEINPHIHTLHLLKQAWAVFSFFLEITAFLSYWQNLFLYNFALFGGDGDWGVGDGGVGDGGVGDGGVGDGGEGLSQSPTAVQAPSLPH